LIVFFLRHGVYNYGLSERGPGRSPGRKPMFTQFGLLKRVSWQHFKSFMCNGNGCYEFFTLWPWAYFTNGPDTAASSAPSTLIRVNSVNVLLRLQKFT